MDWSAQQWAAWHQNGDATDTKGSPAQNAGASGDGAQGDTFWHSRSCQQQILDGKEGDKNGASGIPFKCLG